MNPLAATLISGVSGLSRYPRMGVGIMAVTLVTLGALLFDGELPASWAMAAIPILSGCAMGIMLTWSMLYREPPRVVLGDGQEVQHEGMGETRVEAAPAPAPQPNGASGVSDGIGGSGDGNSQSTPVERASREAVGEAV